MKKRYFLFACLLASLSMFSQTNMGFESNLNGWTAIPGMLGAYDINDGFVINPGGSNDDDCTELRFQVVDQAFVNADLYVDNHTIQGSGILRLGNQCTGDRAERIEQSFTVTPTNYIFEYSYAFVAEETDGSCDHITYPIDCALNWPLPINTPVINNEKPFFRVYLEQNGEKIECSEFVIFGDERFFDLTTTNPAVLVRNWSTNNLNLLDYVEVGEQVTIVAEVGDCNKGGHFGYAYFEASTNNNDPGDPQISVSSTNVCVGEFITFDATNGGNDDFIWKFYDNDDVTLMDVWLNNSISYSYNDPGVYRVEYGRYMPFSPTTCNSGKTIYINVRACGTPSSECEDCFSFKLESGKKYSVSAWVKEDLTEPVPSYNKLSIDVFFAVDDPSASGPSFFSFTPQGRIIDGWQRIYGELIVPNDVFEITIDLNNDNTNAAYFDDIRFHPFNGNMKSFVYDPLSQRLMAELDENNYASFYEYDQEGNLIRIKKETKEGVKTIQESRTHTSINP